MTFRVARAVGTLLAVVISVLLATALPAAAHNELKSSNPPSGATLDTAPAAVVLTFTEDLTPGQTTVTVAGPDGADAAAGPAQLKGPVATVPLKPTAAGAYTVTYEVVAEDGDATGSELTFTLTAAAVPAATTTTPTTIKAAPTSQVAAPVVESGSSSDIVWWPWAVGGVLVLVLVGVLVVVLRRRAGQSGTPAP